MQPLIARQSIGPAFFVSMLAAACANIAGCCLAPRSAFGRLRPSQLEEPRVVRLPGGPLAGRDRAGITRCPLGTREYCLWYRGGRIFVLNGETGGFRLAATVPLHLDSVVAPRSGRSVFVTGDRGWMRVGLDGRFRGPLRAPARRIGALAVSGKRGLIAAITGKSKIIVWRRGARRPAAILQPLPVAPCPATSLAQCGLRVFFSRGGHYLFGCGPTGYRCWAIAHRDGAYVFHNIPVPIIRNAVGARPSPRGRHLFVWTRGALPYLTTCWRPQTIFMLPWPAPRGRGLTAPKLTAVAMGYPGRSWPDPALHVSPNGRWLAIGRTVFDQRDRRLYRCEGTSRKAFSDNSRQLAVLGRPSVRIYRLPR